MLKDSIIGLAIGIFVISSIAWVSQWRRIRERMKAAKAMRIERENKAKGETGRHETMVQASEWPI